MSETAHAPLVSICMPAYNHAGYVGFAIESILSQSCGDFELLINDDCSPDLTFDVIRSYDDPRIKAVRQDYRSGPSVTLNAAMRRARGKYIALCASDDVWLPEKLQRQLAFMETHPDVAALFGKPWLIDAQGARLPDSAHNELAADFGGESFDRRQWLLWLFRKGNCLCATSPLLRTDAVRATGEFDPLMLQLQDLDYWVRLLQKFNIRLSTDRLVEYRVSSGGANISSASMASYARIAYEYYRVLGRFADGDAADTVAAAPLQGEALFTWQAAAPSRDLLLAQQALECALSNSLSASYFLFAMDCFHRHGANAAGLAGATGEKSLFTLPLFEVTGSSLAQDVLLGMSKSISLEQALIARQGEIDALRAELDVLKRKSAPPAPEQFSGGLRDSFTRAFGRGKKP
jgi:hypothetical protein